ncbi:hypothetical protein BD410DRAFT_796145 [Rickenella mellea]|uniref:Uncharacterized protein n=1 Tax=Rickenella mellea TaxID=50990 RepID=A0A4Y7PKN4_9AGAM|nr:hypothetical protein BD410DRAFT_796145 [Rickenella mellea]
MSTENVHGQYLNINRLYGITLTDHSSREEHSSRILPSGTVATWLAGAALGQTLSITVT